MWHIAGVRHEDYYHLFNRFSSKRKTATVTCVVSMQIRYSWEIFLVRACLCFKRTNCGNRVTVQFVLKIQWRTFASCSQDTQTWVDHNCCSRGAAKPIHKLERGPRGNIMRDKPNLVTLRGGSKPSLTRRFNLHHSGWRSWCFRSPQYPLPNWVFSLRNTESEALALFFRSPSAKEPAHVNAT